MTREEIFKQIEQERVYQMKRWGNDQDDTGNEPFHWVSYIARYATSWMSGMWSPMPTYVVDDFRTAMLKTATIAIAAVESIDRQREANGKTFFEKD